MKTQDFATLSLEYEDKANCAAELLAKYFERGNPPTDETHAMQLGQIADEAMAQYYAQRAKQAAHA